MSALPKGLREEIARSLEFYRDLGVNRVSLEIAEQLEGFSPEQESIRERGPAVVNPPEPCESDMFRASQRKLYELRSQMGNCQRCRLAGGRTTIVFGSGNPCAPLMFVGEGPGREEDMKGLPFVGAAGDLLTRMINAMQFTRDEVYIANIVKCRPPQNRDPEPDEVDTCMSFLEKQIEIIAPKALVLLGRVAAQSLLRVSTSITAMRGAFKDYKGIPAMVTYHPAYLLRNPKAKKTVWDDLQQVMKIFGKTPAS